MTKIDTFKEQTKTKKQVFLAMISAAGIQENIWSRELINHIVKLEDLF
jgi:hypothetical protein